MFQLIFLPLRLKAMFLFLSYHGSLVNNLRLYQNVETDWSMSYTGLKRSVIINMSTYFILMLHAQTLEFILFSMIINNCQLSTC